MQGKLEKHSSSFRDEPILKICISISRQEKELRNGISTGLQGGLHEGGKNPD